MKMYIYTLSDDTGVRYVGQTRDVGARYRSHLSDKSGSVKSVWIQNLGYNPDIKIVETTDKNNVDSRERHWIDFYNSSGCDLTNTAFNRGIQTVNNDRSDFLAILNSNCGWLVKLLAVLIFLAKPDICNIEEDDFIDLYEGWDEPENDKKVAIREY